MSACTLIAALATSAHFGLVGDYNSIHPALKCDRDDSGIIAGAYFNSESRVSAYAGWKLSSAKEGSNLWAEVGAVTGYTSGDVLPYARVGIDITPRASIFLAPAIEEKRGGDYRIGAVLGLEVRFGDY